MDFAYSLCVFRGKLYFRRRNVVSLICAISVPFWSDFRNFGIMFLSFFFYLFFIFLRRKPSHLRSEIGDPMRTVAPHRAVFCVSRLNPTAGFDRSGTASSGPPDWPD